MQSIAAKFTRGLPKGSIIPTCDNSGAKMLRIVGVKHLKTVKGRLQSAMIGDMITASVVKGRPDMRKTVVNAIIVRQKKEFRRPNGTRVKFETNAAVVLKDDKGNPKGSMIKSAIAKECAKRWPAVSKIASIIV